MSCESVDNTKYQVECPGARRRRERDSEKRRLLAPSVAKVEGAADQNRKRHRRQVEPSEIPSSGPLRVGFD
jgi:hypothetical protein